VTVQRRSCKGFTLVELMITLVIIGIAVALATPTFRMFVEKRQLTAAAEEVVSFIAMAQSLAIKRNAFATVKWSALNLNNTQRSDTSHPPNWCMGIYAPTVLPDEDTVGVAAGCDCRITDPANAAACTVDGALYRLGQSDFVDLDSEFMDFQRSQGHFTFDPVRGIIADGSHDLNLNGNSVFDFHSSDDSMVDGKRLFELRVRVRMTGEVRVCTDQDRFTIVGGYPRC